MTIIPNHTKNLLQAGELAIGLGVKLVRSVDIGKIAKTCDYDFLFIDLEHSALNLETASDISVAALDAGCTPIVRASSHAHHHASRPLDNGAQSIVVPHVNTVAEAQRVADTYNDGLPPSLAPASWEPLIKANGFAVAFPDQGRLAELAAQLIRQREA